MTPSQAIDLLTSLARDHATTLDEGRAIGEAELVLYALIERQPPELPQDEARSPSHDPG